MKTPLLVACLSLALAAADAKAFVFSDGTVTACIAGGRAVIEVDGGPDSQVVRLGYTGMTTLVGSGYQIQWNAKRLAQLPPVVHDMIFFHECAHAQVPTTDELRANCAGLKAMRAAGRGGFAVESKLATFFGPRNEYWARTFKCADADTPAPAGAPAPKTDP